MYARLLSALVAFHACLFSTLNADVRIAALHGNEIAPYTKEIVQICHQIYREAPYFYNGDDAGYEAYLEAYSTSKGAIICLVFDHEQVIGLAAGMPMLETREFYQQPFLDNNYDLDSFFYVGEFGLQPEYHGLGIEEMMYQTLVNFALKDGHAKDICLWGIVPTSPQVKGYVPNEDFWLKIGFKRHPELNFCLNWTNIGATEESSHPAVYWVKTKL